MNESAVPSPKGESGTNADVSSQPDPDALTATFQSRSDETGDEPPAAMGDATRSQTGPAAMTPGSEPVLGTPGALGTLGVYRLLRVLGEGGMGQVYLAIHSKLDKQVAIKTIPADRLNDPKTVVRFEREMKAVGRLDHPNIVQAMDAGEIDGKHFLVMEYVEGCNLSELVHKIGPLQVADACELVRQAADGLHEAHGHGMVHRDVKPSNLMLARPSRKGDRPLAKILDLGLARLSDVHAAGDDGNLSVATSQMMGTLDYMAPEQGSDSHQVDARADVYSLGATLYKLLTGLAPFEDGEHDTVVSKLMALATRVPHPLHELRPDVPAELSAIVGRMLAKFPAERLATAEEVAVSLEPFCKGCDLAALMTGSVASNPESRPSISITVRGRTALVASAQPQAHRFSTFRWTGAVCLALLLGGTGWFWLSRDRAGDRDHLSPAETRLPQADQNKAGEFSGRDNSETESAPPIAAGSAQQWPPDAPPAAVAPFDSDTAQRHQTDWAKYLNVPVEYTNSIGMKFRLIPPGEYLRGASAQEIAASEIGVVNSPQWIVLIRSSGPQHRTILTQPLYLGVYEVTQQEFERITGSNPSMHSPHGDWREHVAGLDTQSFPVDSVSWNAAVDFCNKLSETEGLISIDERQGKRVANRDGHGYRLPTEAEWEFACRAGTQTRYSTGETIADLNRVGWYRDNSDGRPHRVGELAANPFQLYDVHGNVGEWCFDRWTAPSYQEFADDVAIDPQGPLPNGIPHPFRGGRFSNYPSNCRSAFRDIIGGPNRNAEVGFRAALSVAAVRRALNPDSR